MGESLRLSSPYRISLYRLVFLLAGVYNLGFMMWLLVSPQNLFLIFRMVPPWPRPVLSLSAAGIGLFGLAYGWAALSPHIARPIIVVGLLAKVLPPVAWLVTVRSGNWPLRTVTLILFDDIVWWVPFGLFLLDGTALGVRIRASAPLICAVTHALVALAAFFLLKPGTEVVANVSERIRYVSTHESLWRAGWAVCTAAALSLVAFYAWWGARVPIRLGVAAFSIAIGALACDLAGQSLFIGWLPENLQTVQRTGSLLAGVAATALYALAGAILTLATKSLSRGSRVAAWILWLTGLALAASTLAQNIPGMILSTAVMYGILPPLAVYLWVKLR